MDKVLSYVNQIMDRADSFNYFVFLSTFVIFLDSVLLYDQGVSIYDLNLGYIKSNITIGSFLVFLCIYSLFMAVVVNGLKLTISQIVLVLPTIQFLQNPESSDLRKWHATNYVSISKMRTYAIKNDNAVALEAIAEKQQEIRNILNLEKNSFAFLLASILSLAVGFEGNALLVVSMFTFSEDASILSFNSLKAFLVGVVYISMFYLGVVRGCCLQISSLGSDDIYFPDNDIKN
ncbi:hypothetical protein [Vibrio parahaemolyticus]|uniref:hypothetical protein n=1 Tax=Vibrio parahaemolyticus TaxID=670 RepID=UPI000C7B85A4|nr:hypothetical protein [Vibrio parahaemolyticus]PLR59063.1 hypothetical protein CYU11_03350 [Vibrio parahaemolyticus]